MGEKDAFKDFSGHSVNTLLEFDHHYEALLKKKKGKCKVTMTTDLKSHHILYSNLSSLHMARGNKIHPQALRFATQLPNPTGEGRNKN